jgi:hypothetical protein
MRNVALVGLHFVCLLVCCSAGAAGSIDAATTLQRDKTHTLDSPALLLSSTRDFYFESLTEDELADHWSQDDGGAPYHTTQPCV